MLLRLNRLRNGFKTDDEPVTAFESAKDVQKKLYLAAGGLVFANLLTKQPSAAADAKSKVRYIYYSHISLDEFFF